MLRVVLSWYVKSGVMIAAGYLGIVEGGVAGHGAGGDHEPVDTSGTPFHVVDWPFLAL